MGCCSKNEDDLPKGMVTKGRGCTDPLCLLLFLAFWAGMAFVGYRAISQGEPQRILYGLDSYGNYCGMLNERDNGTVTVDLRGRKKLHYLNPLELLSPTGYRFARAVCVEECPTAAAVCAADDFPCTSPDDFICPYYGYSPFGANGSDALGLGVAGGVSVRTDWWAALPASADDACFDADLLAAMPAAVIDAYNATESCGGYYQAASLFPEQGPCAAVLFETAEFMHRCYPVIPKSAYDSISATGAGGLVAGGLEKVPTAQITSVVDRVADLADGGFNTYVTDAQRGYEVILVTGPAAALVLCLVYMVLMRFLAGFVAWSVIVLINVLFAACTVLAAYKSELLGKLPAFAELNSVMAKTGDTLEGNHKTSVQVVTYVLAALTVIMLILTLLMARRIKIAIACLKVAAAAVATMPSIMFFPLLTFTSFLVLFGYWVVVFAYQWSAGAVVELTRDTTGGGVYTLDWMFAGGGGGGGGDAAAEAEANGMAAAPPPPAVADLACHENPDCRYTVTFSREQQYFLAYHIFGLLWTNQFIVGFGYVVIAHCVGQYYWTRGIRKEMTSFPVATAIKVATLHHLGTIAFGSFLVALIQFVRLLLEYIDRKTKKMQQGNPAAKWVMCCLRYCLWYLEKVMKFINRNAYIIVAVKGYSYCRAALRAMKLILNNFARLAAVNIIGDALIFLGKLTVVAACGAAAFFMTTMDKFSDPTSDNYLSSPVVPVLLACLAAYVVASIFFAVYEMAVDTILLSFCEDCMSHNETPQFAPKLLMSALGKASAFEKQQAAKKIAAADGSKQELTP